MKRDLITSESDTARVLKAFVLVQYFGYLRRNPNDAPEPGLNFDGYNFWLNKLNEFGGNFVNAEMVKAFLVSGEYRQRFGPDSESVTLVLLSYNRGPEWVRNTLRELRGTENYERNFWTLLANRETLDETFRNENAGYVPRFFAAAIIGENPEAFELPMEPLSSLASGGKQ